MKKLFKSAILACLLAIAMMQPALAENNQTAPTINSIRFATNYTVSSNTYAKGGTSIVITANISNVVNKTAGYYNVSAKIYNATGLITTVYLNNASAAINDSAIWNASYTVPSVSFSNGNITINATYFNTTDWLENNTQHIHWYVDSTAPSAGDPAVGTNTNNFTWKGRTGNSKTVTATVTDAVSVGTVTFDFTTVPTGSSLTDTAMTCSGTTTATCTYSFTPDKLGTYVYRVYALDSVTNAAYSSSYQLSFSLDDSDDDYLAAQGLISGGYQETPSKSGSSSSSPMSIVGDAGAAVGNGLGGIGGLFGDIGGILAGIPGMLTGIFEPILNMFGG